MPSKRISIGIAARLACCFWLISSSLSHAQNTSPILEFPVLHYTIPGTAAELNVYYHIPDTPKAVIYFFHGSAGDATAWLRGVEQPLLLQQAVERNFGIVALESDNRDGIGWAKTTDPQTGQLLAERDNIDTQNLYRVHAMDMIGGGKYGEEVPVFAAGFSNGGAYASRLGLRASSSLLANEGRLPDVSNIVPFRAAAIYGATGAAVRYPSYDLPTIFNSGINDAVTPAYPNMTGHPNWPYGDNMCVSYHYDLLVARNVRTELNIKREESLEANRFERIPGIDARGSVAIFIALRDARHPDTGGALYDSTGVFLRNPRNTWWLPFLPAEFEALTNEIYQQLLTVFAEHVAMADFAANTLDFFEKQLATTGAPSPGAGPPSAFQLLPNYPNPFNPSTTIPYQLDRPAPVRITIFNAQGDLVQVFHARHTRAGEFQVVWNGRDAAGSAVASGVYFYRLESDSQRHVRKMVLVR